MTDFLKVMPSVTLDDYMWKWTIPQIKLAMYDYTHIEYHTEEENKKNVKTTVINSAEDLMNDLGFTIFTDKKQ